MALEHAPQLRPHYNEFTASREKYEVVNPSLFEVTLLPPAAAGISNTGLFLEHVKSIDGLGNLNPAIGLIEQKAKYSERSFLGAPETTSLDLTITFTMNLDHANNNYIYTMLRKWTNIGWDPATGTMGVKRDYCGDMIIIQYNRDGSVWREILCKNAIPYHISGVTDSLSSEDGNTAAELVLNIKCNTWDERVIGLTD